MTLAPIAIPAQSALAVAALAVQGFADVETLGGTRPLSLYFLTVAQSGERKSSCDGLMLAPLRQYEREQSKIHEGDMAAWTDAYAIWENERDRILAEIKKGNSDKSKATATRADLDAHGKAPVPPVSPDRTVTEPTYEGLTRKYVQGNPSQGLFSDEGGQFLGGHAMSTDNRQKTLAALNDLWQGNPIRRTRQGDGSFTLYGRRLSIHLMAQPGVALAFLADPMTADTGFLSRFLICDPESTIGTRLHSRIRRDDAAMAELEMRLTSILQTSMPTEGDNDRELRPRYLPLSQNARALLVRYSDRVESEQASGGVLEHVTGAASKSAEQACRIAGVLTLWADLDAPDVSAEAMANGITLAQFYLSEAARLASAAAVSPEVDQAERLRKWLLGSWPYSEVLVSDVLQKGPGRALRESAKARAAIRILEAHGWLAPLEAGTVVRGKPRKESWRIVRGAADDL